MHDTRYNDLIKKFRMNPDEFFYRKNKSPMFDAVVEHLSREQSVYRILSDVINRHDDAIDILNRVACDRKLL